ncbi:MAG TPA: Xaa-Pro peptidase family protein [Actinomycetota bacterium]|nr:Xaa-Pro peptidase family protein [Actinomycetota bacterium]
MSDHHPMHTSPINTKARRDAVRARLEELGADALLVTKPVNVRYLTGFSGSNGQLVVGEEDIFFTDSRYEEQSRHQVPDCRREIFDSRSGWDRIVPELGTAARIAIEAHHLTVASAGRLKAALGDGRTLVEAENVVESRRLIKDAGEIERIRRACAFGDAGFQEILGRLREGMTEVELAAELEDAMRRAGSEGLSFDTIVAFGESAAEPHHEPIERRLKRGDVVKLDFGATFEGYHSDMTRTIAFGDPGEEMRTVYEAVRAGQQAGLEAVKDGASSGDVDEASRAPIRAAGYDYGHATGHGCGLEVHEAPTVRSKGADILAPGMTVTVEPGIYLPGLGGVRIEDLLAVTADGYDVLTTSPKELIVV